MPFQFNAGERVLAEKTRLEIMTGGSRSSRAKLDQDFRPLPFSDNGEASGEVVFAGYGLVVPGETARATILTRAGREGQNRADPSLRAGERGTGAARAAQSLCRTALQSDARPRTWRESCLGRNWAEFTACRRTPSAHERLHKFGQWHHRRVNQRKNGRRASRRRAERL